MRQSTLKFANFYIAKSFPEKMQKKKIVIGSENPAAYSVFLKTLNENIFMLESYPRTRQNNEKISRKKDSAGQSAPFYNRIKIWMYGKGLGLYIYYFLLKYLMAVLFILKTKFEIFKIQRRFSNNDICAVIISSDRGISSDLSLSLWAKKNRKKVVLMEYAQSAGFESASKSRRCGAFKFLPERSMTSESGLRYYLPHHELALRWLRALPPNPWVLGQGLSDVFIVGTAYEKDRLISKGVCYDKVMALGSVPLDDVLRKMSLESGSLADVHESCLLAVPQYWEHDLLDKKSHFDAIEEMFKILSLRFKKVYASLHPKMSLPTYKPLAQKYNIEILSSPLSESMGVADYFVSTYSSTILWALLAKKKMVIVDHAGLNYKEFYPELDLKIVYSNEELELFLTEGFWCDSQNEFKYDWSLSAKVRINRFISGMIEK